MADKANTAPAAQEEAITLMDYMKLSVGGIHSAIGTPTIAANYLRSSPGCFRLSNRPNLVGWPQRIQRSTFQTLWKLCETFKLNGVTDDAICLLLFPFALQDSTKSWLNSLPVNSITTWEELCQKFLNKFFLFEKQVKLRNEIVTFAQYDGETLYESKG